LTFPVVETFSPCSVQLSEFMVIELNDCAQKLKDEFDYVCEPEIVYGFYP